MNFHQIKADLKEEHYTNAQIAQFMGISIRSFYYYSKNAYSPTPDTTKKINKTYIKIIRYEQKQKDIQEKKRLKVVEKLKAKEREEKEIKEIKEIIDKKPILHGFDSDKILSTVKDHGIHWVVSYALQYEYVVKDKHGIVIDGPCINYTNEYKDPANAIIEMDRVLNAIASSADIFLLSTSWYYDKYAVGLESYY
jgi:AraC-like DNA-binding protein